MLRHRNNAYHYYCRRRTLYDNSHWFVCAHHYEKRTYGLGFFYENVRNVWNDARSECLDYGITVHQLDTATFFIFRCVEGMGYVFTLKILFLADSLNVPLPKHLLKSDPVKLKYDNNENKF